MRKNGNCRLFQTLLGVFSLVLVFGCTEKEEGSPTASTTTSWDTGTFIAQYESSGSRTWVQSFGTNGPLINAMATDSNENIAITGSSGSSTDFDPGSEVVNETGWASSDAFVSRYTSSGEFSWAETVGDTKIDAGKAVAFDTNGNVYYSGVLMAGGDIGTADFGSAGTKPIVGSIDMFVEKLASNGDETECLYYSGNGSNHISSTSMVTNGSSEVFITGYFNASRDFDFDSDTVDDASNGNYDIFVTKIDSNLSHGWTKTFGGSEWDHPNSIALDADGNVYITGYFSGTVDFDPSTGIDIKISSGIAKDAFVTKLDSNGDYEWTRAFGSNQEESGKSLKIDSIGNIYVVGSFESFGVDFDPDLDTDTDMHNRSGDMDMFIMKLSADGTYNWTKTIGESGAGGDAEVSPHSIGIDSNNDLYVAGTFSHTVDFNPGTATDNKSSSNSSTDVFLTKFESNGDYGWTVPIGSSSDDSGGYMTVTPFDRILISGNIH